MKKLRNKWTGILTALLSMALLAGCQGAGSDVPQITKEVAEAMAEEEDDKDAEPLQEENTLPEDGIVTAAQMKTIAGKEGIYHFNGTAGDSISYQWEYDGEKIQNPIEQRLKVECASDNTEKIQKAANNAPYGLGVALDDMEMAAPAKLSITLNEKWDADKVIYCAYEDNKIYQLAEGSIEGVKEEGKKVSRISFPVTKAGGTFYVLAGSSQGGGKSAASEEKKKGENGVSPGQDQAAASHQAGSPGQENPGDNGSGDPDEISDPGQSPGQDQQAGQDFQEDLGQGEIHTCTLSIDCSTLVGKTDLKQPEKAEFVPADGWILAPTEVTYTPGETVFDVIKRACGERGIQMESRYTPIYGSYYIEGINQLYEFDGGAQSGWMYCVNGWFPNYGCSSYTVEDGDQIEWRYTCNLGSDVGNEYTGEGQ